MEGHADNTTSQSSPSQAENSQTGGHEPREAVLAGPVLDATVRTWLWTRVRCCHWDVAVDTLLSCPQVSVHSQASCLDTPWEAIVSGSYIHSPTWGTCMEVPAWPSLCPLPAEIPHAIISRKACRLCPGSGPAQPQAWGLTRPLCLLCPEVTAAPGQVSKAAQFPHPQLEWQLTRQS